MTLQPDLWWVNIALPLTGGGALAVRHGAGDARAASRWPRRDARWEPSRLSPTWWGLGLPALLTPSVQAASRPRQPGHPPMLGWADKSEFQGPLRLVDKSGHCPPCPGLSQSLRMVPEEPRHPWVPGQPPQTSAPALGTPECLHAPSLGWFHVVSEGALMGLGEKERVIPPTECVPTQG